MTYVFNICDLNRNMHGWTVPAVCEWNIIFLVAYGFIEKLKTWESIFDVLYRHVSMWKDTQNSNISLGLIFWVHSCI